MLCLYLHESLTCWGWLLATARPARSQSSRLCQKTIAKKRNTAQRRAICTGPAGFYSGAAWFEAQAHEKVLCGGSCWASLRAVSTDNAVAFLSFQSATILPFCFTIGIGVSLRQICWVFYGHVIDLVYPIWRPGVPASIELSLSLLP